MFRMKLPIASMVLLTIGLSGCGAPNASENSTEATYDVGTQNSPSPSGATSSAESETSSPATDIQLAVAEAYVGYLESMVDNGSVNTDFVAHFGSSPLEEGNGAKLSRIEHLDLSGKAIFTETYPFVGIDHLNNWALAFIAMDIYQQQERMSSMNENYSWTVDASQIEIKENGTAYIGSSATSLKDDQGNVVDFEFRGIGMYPLEDGSWRVNYHMLYGGEGDRGDQLHSFAEEILGLHTS